MRETSQNAAEMVSVVIPTRGRPDLVPRAVKSVLAQTLDHIEVVVVVDGPDEDTVRALGRMVDARLRTVVLPSRMGPTGARNAGVREARGSWIALLDDDDEMLPRRLEAQLEAARRSRHALPIVTSRCIVRTPRDEAVRPKKLIAPSERLDEYIFTRDSFVSGQAAIMTTFLLIKKELLTMLPFRSGLQLHSHDDWEWLLRVSALEGVGFETVPEPLTVYNREERETLSGSADWRRSLAWIRENRDLVTPRAYSGFVLSVAGRLAVREGDRKAFLPLLREAVRFGKPGFFDLLWYIARWIATKGLRRRVRLLVTR